MTIRIIKAASSFRPARMLAKLGQTAFESTAVMPTDNGFYACRFVADTEISRVFRLARLCGVEPVVPEDDALHVTLAVSEKFPNGSVLRADRGYVKVVAREWETWEGHNGKGYIVLRVESGELHRRNAQMKDAGCVSNFPDYQPHITIAQGKMLTLDELKAANRELDALRPFDILLGPERFNVAAYD